jgi:hypothetical protein
VGVVARLQLARVLAVLGNAGEAKAAYRDFLSRWKDADPTFPYCSSKPRRNMPACRERRTLPCLAGSICKTRTSNTRPIHIMNEVWTLIIDRTAASCTGSISLLDASEWQHNRNSHQLYCDFRSDFFSEPALFEYGAHLDAP